MPTNPTWTFERLALLPLYHANKAQRMNVALGNNLTLAQGTVLGEVTATPGVYIAYASSHSDGSQVAKCILEYACSTDGSGNITCDGEWGLTRPSISAFLGNSGVAFSIADLTGLDATALTALGGSIAQGALGATGTVIL